MQPSKEEGGRRLPARELPPELPPPARPRTRTPEELEQLRRERRERAALYDDFDSFYPGRDTRRKPKKKPHNILWGIVLVLCLLMEATLALFMAPQLLGIRLQSVPSYAFAGGSVLTWEPEVYDSFDAMRMTDDSYTIHQGVSIDGVAVGGMTRAQAIAALKDVLPVEGASFDLRISIAGDDWLVGSADIPMSRNLNTVVEQAFAIGRSNTASIRQSKLTPLQERVNTIEALKTQPVDLKTEVVFDRTALRSVTDGIAARYNVEPVNAGVKSFDFTTKKFSFTGDKSGIFLSADELYAKVAGCLDRGEYFATVAMTPQSVLAPVTKAELMNSLRKISTYTTNTTSNKNRNTNIELSANAINGMVVGPGEVFSFNQATGQRTAGKGYKEATAISGGKTNPEIGGGVCQTSSTLFNAVARADLEIVTRSPHAWPSSYVKEGMDATVNWPGLDFQFRNNTEFPIYIVAWYKDRKVTVEIYGRSLGDGVTIDLENRCTKTIKAPSETKEVLNEALPHGTRQTTVEARNGSVWETYKVWFSGKQEIKRELLCTSTYKAYQKTVEYN